MKSVCLTPVVNDEQLLPVSNHTHHRTWQAEDFPLDPSNGEKAERQRTGGDRSPALTQAQGLGVLALRQVHHPLLISVPGREVEALKLTEKRRGAGSKQKMRKNVWRKVIYLASSSVLGHASSTASWERSAMT